MDIQLNLINQSNDANNSQIVIFQKNVADNFGETAIAWKVIENLGHGDHHPFIYPLELSLAAADSYGNFTPQVSAQEGQRYAITAEPPGEKIGGISKASQSQNIEVVNQLSQGAMSVGLFRDGRLLAAKTAVAPLQMATFQFLPQLWIGVVSAALEGQVMNAAILSMVNTELSLLGIQSADIIMTGGGPGPSSTPFTFTLKNVVPVRSGELASGGG